MYIYSSMNIHEESLVIRHKTNFSKYKKGSKDQESIQSSTTPVPGYQIKSEGTNRNNSYV